MTERKQRERFYLCSICEDGRRPFRKFPPFDKICPHCKNKSLTRVRYRDAVPDVKPARKSGETYWKPGQCCPRCGSTYQKVRTQQCRNGKYMYRMECSRCHAYLKFLSQRQGRALVNTSPRMLNQDSVSRSKSDKKRSAARNERPAMSAKMQCAHCGEKETLHRWQLARAAAPRCPACGGPMQQLEVI